MTPNDPNLLWIFLMALQGTSPQSIPESLRGSFIADPSAPTPIPAISVDAEGLSVSGLRCKAASLSNGRDKTQGNFLCARSHSEPFSLPQTKTLRLRITMDPQGALNVAGFDGENSRLKFLPETAAPAATATATATAGH